MKKLRLPLCLAAAFPFAIAQSISDKTSPSPDPAGEEVVTLEEFSVTGAAMKDSYIASEATTGTRLGGAIIDMPFNVAVFTQELADDFMLEGDDLMTLVSGATVGTFETDGEEGGGLTLRGFSVLSLRDGFKYYNQMSFNLNNDRSEILKGPSSIMYGRATPGGLRNSISRKPRSKSAYHFETSVGAFNTRSAGVSATGPIHPKNLWYYAAARYAYNESDIDFYWRETSNLYARALYKITRDASLTLGLDYKRVRGAKHPGAAPGGFYVPSVGKIPYADKVFDRDDPSTYFSATNGNYSNINERTGLVDPYINLSVTGSPVIRGWGGLADLVSFNRMGPNTSDAADYRAATLLYEHRLNRSLSFRLSALHFDEASDAHWWSGNVRYYAERASYDADGNLIGAIIDAREPWAESYDQRVNAVQAELLSVFKTGSVTHRVLSLLDLTKVSSTRANYTFSDEDLSRLRDSVKYLNIYNPDWGLDTDWSLCNDPEWKQYRHDQALGATVSWTASFLKERLLAMGSLRWDSVKAHNLQPGLGDAIIGAGGVVTGYTRENASSDYSDLSYSATMLYRIVPQKISAYVSHSTSFNDSAYTLSIDSGTHTFVKPSNSVGFEIGLKGQGLLSNRLSFTLSASRITQKNVKSPNPEYIAGRTSDGTPQYSATLENRAQGIELSTDWKLSDQILLKLGAAYTDSEVLSSTQPWMIGQPVRGASKYDANALLRYTFPKNGPLNGFVVGVMGTYRSSFLANYETYYDNATFPVSSSDYTRNDGTVIPAGESVNRGWKYALNDPEIWLVNYERCVTPSYCTFNAFIQYKWKWRSYTPMLQLNCNNITDKNFIDYQGRWYNQGRVFALTAKLDF
jgi:outer membrane receptor protein involved in Fe transport